MGGFLGSLLAVDSDFLEGIAQRQSLAASYESVHIVRAQLGSNILMIGAAELAFTRLLADPAMTLDALQ